MSKTAKAGVALPLADKSIKAKFVAPVKDYNKSDLNNWSAVLHANFNKNNFFSWQTLNLLQKKICLP